MIIYSYCGVNELNVNRWFEKDRTLKCPFCVNNVENEKHFFIDCPLYEDLRQKYLAPYLHIAKLRNIGYLLDGRDISMLRNVSMFIHYALKMRSEQICI